MKPETKKSIYVMYPITTYNLSYNKRAQIDCVNWWYLIDSSFEFDLSFFDSKFKTIDKYFIDNSFLSIQKEILNLRKTGELYGERYYQSLYMAVILEYPVKACINNCTYNHLWLVNNEGEVLYEKILDGKHPDFLSQSVKKSVKVGDIVEFMDDRKIRLGIVCNIVYYEHEDKTIRPSAYDLLVNRSISGYDILKRVLFVFQPQVEVPKEMKESFEKYYDMYKANQSLDSKSIKKSDQTYRKH